jgi:hypothetical protein
MRNERWVVYHGVFGGWGWERFDAAGHVVAESRGVFDDLEECIQDARLHGCVDAPQNVLEPA